MLKILLILLPVALLAAPAAAQNGLMPADSAEVANHLVTEAEYARFSAIVMRMDSAFAADPSAFSGIERDSDEPVSLEYAAARYESSAAMRAELARAGMTSREFLVAALALMDAQWAAESNDPSHLDTLPLPQIANARLVRCRIDEVGRLLTIIRTVVRG